MAFACWQPRKQGLSLASSLGAGRSSRLPTPANSPPGLSGNPLLSPLRGGWWTPSKSLRRTHKRGQKRQAEEGGRAPANKCRGGCPPPRDNKLLGPAWRADKRAVWGEGADKPLWRRHPPRTPQLSPDTATQAAGTRPDGGRGAGLCHPRPRHVTGRRGPDGSANAGAPAPRYPALLPLPHLQGLHGFGRLQPGELRPAGSSPGDAAQPREPSAGAQAPGVPAQGAPRCHLPLARRVVMGTGWGARGTGRGPPALTIDR